MKQAGVKKYKNHQVLIFRATSAYIEMLKDEVSELQDSSDSKDEIMQSMDSDELNDDFEFVMLLKEARDKDSDDGDGKQAKYQDKQRLVEADVDKINL
jgi:hypothetical protein